MKEKHKRKKIYLPILLRIALLLLSAQIISTALFRALGNDYLIKEAVSDRSQDAYSSAIGFISAMGPNDGLEKISSDEEFRNSMRRRARYICYKMNLRYLYLYTVDENNWRHYLICAAASDEDDAKINEDFGFDSIDKIEELYDAEVDVLNGKKEKAYEFVDNEYGHVCMFVVPVTNRSGAVKALIGVDFSIDNILAVTNSNMKFAFVIDLTIFLLELIITLILIRHSVVQPILITAERMKSFVKEHNVSIIRKNRLFNDEVSDIQEAFHQMEFDISNDIKKIELLSSEKAQHRAQLEIARKIQNGIVPEEMNLSGFGYEAYGSMMPALEVGGDFYDIFSLEENKICLVVGDISGKGVAAALFMTMVKTAIKERIISGMKLSETLNDLNKEILLSNPENMFATVFTAILDCSTGKLSYANAGHNPPLLLKNDSEFLSLDPGIALGFFEDADIKEYSINLSPGEGLLIYTDGVTESVNAEKKLYGEERLKDLVSKKSAAGAKNIVKKVVESVHAYSEGLPQSDDITCSAILYTGNAEKRTLSMDISSFAVVKDTILSSFGNTAKSRSMIMVCEEMFSNIVNYSGADYVSFSCENKGSLFSVTFTDNGIPFDPVNSSIKEKSFDDFDTGGMGIKLARMNTKEMVYSRDGNKNVLVLRFDVENIA